MASIKTAREKVASFSWVILAFLIVLAMINFADKAVIGFAAVPIIKEFHLTAVQYGFLGGAFWWLYSISAASVTTLSDRIGTKRVLASLSVVWAVAQFGILFIASFPLLVAMRVLLGAGEGPSYPTSIHAVAKWFPSGYRGLGFSAISFGGSIGPAVFATPLILLIAAFGWRTAFALLGTISLVWVVLWLLVGRESPVEMGSAADTSQIASHETKRLPWRQLVPILFSRNFLFTMLVLFAAYWVLGILISWIPPYLQLVRHLGGVSLSFVVAIPWASLAILQVVFSSISDFYFRRTGSSNKSRVYFPGTLLLLGVLLYYAATLTPSLALTVACFSIATAFVGTGFSIGGTIVAEIAPTEHRGSAQGILVGVASFGGIIAPPLAGAVIQAAGRQLAIGFNSVFLLTSGIVLVTAVLFLLAVRPERKSLVATDLAATVS